MQHSFTHSEQTQKSWLIMKIMDIFGVEQDFVLSSFGDCIINLVSLKIKKYASIDFCYKIIYRRFIISQKAETVCRVRIVTKYIQNLALHCIFYISFMGWVKLPCNTPCIACPEISLYRNYRLGARCAHCPIRAIYFKVLRFFC